MTPKRVTQRRTRLEKHFDTVFQDIVAGLSGAEIAVKYKVDPSAVTYFKRRNAEALDQAMREVTDYSKQTAIADKQYRLMVKDRLESLLETVREARSRGETGEDTGLVTKTYKMIGSGESAKTVVEYRVDTALVAAIDSLHKSAAEELGQLPRPDQNINIKQLLLVREIDGASIEELG